MQLRPLDGCRESIDLLGLGCNELVVGLDGLVLGCGGFVEAGRHGVRHLLQDASDCTALWA